MVISAFELLYKKLGIVSETDYQKRRDYEPPINVQFVRQYDTKEEFLKDYAFYSTPGYVVRGLCFNYYSAIRNRFSYMVGHNSDYGNCVYTESYEVHKAVQISSMDYICMYCALQVLEQHPEVLQALDQCAQKYGNDSDQVKQIWFAFFYKNSGERLKQYQKLVIHFADEYKMKYDYCIVPIEQVRDFILNRNKREFKVSEKYIKCQVFEPILTVKAKQALVRQKERDNNILWWKSYGFIVACIVVSIILNGIGIYAGQDMDSPLALFMLFGGFILSLIIGTILSVKCHIVEEAYSKTDSAIGVIFNVFVLWAVICGMTLLALGGAGLMLGDMFTGEK